PDRTCSMTLIPFVPFSCDDVGMFNANFSFSAFQIFSISNRRFWLDCWGLCPPVIKQVVFWILFLGLGCLFLLQKLHERKQHPAKASLATAASHSSPTLQLLRCRRLPDNRPNPNRRQYCRHHQL